MKKREGIKKKAQQNQLWDILNDILITKSGTLLDDKEYEKNFSLYMLLKVMSMDIDLIGYVNLINKMSIISTLDKKRAYLMLIKLLPTHTKRIQYIKSSVEKIDNIDYVAKHFECSPKEAKFYINTYGDEWAKNIKNSFGGIKDE